nr:hypothetical protein [uncultured Dyadobacter sp.]
MSKTVVGIFEYESDAQNAQNYLLANGYGEGDVDLKTATYKSEETESPDGDESLMDRIGNFFRELFSDDEEETERYIQAGKRGTIVTVHALTADEAVAAAHVMDEHGAIDVTNSQFNQRPGQQYEDPIVNPPGISTGRETAPDSVDARGVYLRSRIIDRPLEQEHRLRQQPFSPGSAAAGDAQNEAPELHKTIAERDALINEIVDNDDIKAP